MSAVEILEEQGICLQAVERPPVRACSAPSAPAAGDSSPKLPLGFLGEGETAEIVSIRDTPEPLRDCRVEDMGLRAGKIVQMLTNGGGGPILLKIDESRLAIGRRMAMKIMVRRPR